MIIKPALKNSIDLATGKPYPPEGKKVLLPSIAERMAEARGDIEIIEDKQPYTQDFETLPKKKASK